MGSQFQEINEAEMGRILAGQDMQAAVFKAANEVAETARQIAPRVNDRDGGPAEFPMPVDVLRLVTDRAHCVIALSHPSGLAVEAKHATLTKAAAAHGLEVRSK